MITKGNFISRLVIVGTLFTILTMNGYGQTKIWPYPIPCRINADISQDILFLTLGDVSTPVSQGTFYPAEDKVVLNNGSTIENYYVDSLGVQYYQPIDKTYYPTAPSGWTSWYSYRYNFNEDTIKKATDFFKRTMKSYGFNIIEIDDGWQSSWGTWKPSSIGFPQGMAKIASYIKQSGFVPGIWTVPQGTNDSSQTVKYDAFMHYSDSSFIHTRIGVYAVDPTAAQGQEYVTQLMDTLAGWGFQYFKIDAQPLTDSMYEIYASNMHIPNMPHAYYYRKTLEAVRNGIGAGSYLTATWGLGIFGKNENAYAPISGIGYINGGRPYWDIALPNQEFFNDVFAGVMWYSYMNNIACYIDLDAFYIGNTIAMNQSQAWTTMIGISGVPMFDGDQLSQLSDERIELMKRICPPVDIHPLDLYPDTVYRKHIWDLKINQNFRQYDVVAVIKTDYYFPSDLIIHWNLMGWDPNDSYHVYDFWNKRYLGIWTDSMVVDVPDSGCRLFSFVKAEDVPQLISTSRHVTQGWVDIDTLAYDSVNMVLSGISSVVGGDPYQLRIAVPNNIQNSYLAVGAEVDSVPFTLRQDSNFITLDFTSLTSEQVPWRIQFAKGPLSVKSNTESPMDLTLHQNYPNPFGIGSVARTNYTTFSFSIAKPQNVDLVIYDILGNRVADLYNGYVNAGSYHIGFDGSMLPYGVYFSSLMAGHTYQTKPFVFEK